VTLCPLSTLHRRLRVSVSHGRAPRLRPQSELPGLRGPGLDADRHRQPRRPLRPPVPARRRALVSEARPLLSPPTVTSTPRRGLLPYGWPLYALFYGYPIWWALGLAEMVWPLFAFFLLAHLIVRRAAVPVP